jgi:gamma-D-glutamyl-L-lysine dipeptidyl-peptidase|tara:strand:+ start:479 stop:1222 length:744 start_codon:yes stop_codon:yes gene_type:complete
MKNNFFFKNQLSNIYKSPSRYSEVISQIIYGEKFKILSKNTNWIKIKTSFDNYVGYIRNKNYVSNYNSTHKVCVLKTSIYGTQRIKKNFLPFGSKVSIISENKNFAEFEKNRWIKKKDLKKIHHKELNYLKIFNFFLKTKYLWGGKTYKGIDCSAILQLFFYYNNRFYPRDTKDQIRYSKKNIKRKIFKKGDIIFWKGHVAICINSKKLIHAYGPKKKVVVMYIKKTISRIENTAKLSIKKISSLNH